MQVKLKGERNKSILFILNLFLLSRDHYKQVSSSAFLIFFHFFHFSNSCWQSVLERNKCMCCSSHALCYDSMRLCAIHNSFACNDVDMIHACHAYRADYQWTQTLSNLDHIEQALTFHLLGEEKNQIHECFSLNTSIWTHFYLWCKLHLKNGNFCFLLN